MRGVGSLDLFVRPGASAEQREAVLLRWLREQLKVLVPPLLEKWQPVLGVQVADWCIKKLKTKREAAIRLHGESGSIWNWSRNRRNALSTS